MDECPDLPDHMYVDIERLISDIKTLLVFSWPVECTEYAKYARFSFTDAFLLPNVVERR